MRTLITGGAGFIGSHLVDALVEEGHETRVLDNLATGSLSRWRYPRHVDFLDGDVRDRDALRGAMRGVDVVFHQAALASVPLSVRDPLASHDVNLTGTFNVLLAARDAGVRRVVYASSSAVYGDTEELPVRESAATRPLSPYASAKLGGEHYCRLFYQLYGLETVSLRYFNVFGPRQDPRSEYAAVIPRFVRAVLEGEPPVIFGDGGQTRDFTPVQNVVAANLGAAHSPLAAGRVYNVGCGQEVSLNDLLRWIARMGGREVSPRYLPAKPGDIRRSVADIQAASRDLVFEPILSVEQGLAELVEATFREPAGVA